MNYTAEFDGNITRVEVFAGPSSDLALLGITGRGEARCRPEDSFSETTGQLIAIGRAIQDFGRQVTEFGDSTVVTKADVARVIDHIEAVLIEKIGGR